VTAASHIASGALDHRMQVSIEETFELAAAGPRSVRVCVEMMSISMSAQIDVRIFHELIRDVHDARGRGEARQSSSPATHPTGSGG